MPIIVGIDPGFTGAVAFLDPGTGALTIYDMPTAPNPKGRTELDLNRLGEVLHPPRLGRCVAVLEQVAARPNQGAPATFRFGQGYGAIEAFLVGHGWERHYVTPSVWKKHFKLSKDKGVSRAMASQRFPGAASQFSRVKDDGRAEAALIALYGQEKLLQSVPA